MFGLCSCLQLGSIFDCLNRSVKCPLDLTEHTRIHLSLANDLMATVELAQTINLLNYIFVVSCLSVWLSVFGLGVCFLSMLLKRDQR